jgi:hypothetical protein
MRFGHAATILLRLIVFCIVVASLALSGRPEPANASAGLSSQGAGSEDAPSFTRALLGFTASLVVMVGVLIMLGAHTDPPGPDGFQIALRGSLD